MTYYPPPAPLRLIGETTPTHRGGDVELGGGPDTGNGRGHILARDLPQADPGVADALWLDPRTGSVCVSGSPSSIVTLARGTIANLAYLDFALPTGYSHFRLIMRTVVMEDTANAWLAFAFSNDGGATFANGAQSYALNALMMSWDKGGFASAGTQDQLMWGSSDITGCPTHADLTIDPGTTLTAATASIVGDICTSDAGGVYRTIVACSTCEEGGPAFPLPADLIRVLPYGNADVNPPTSGIHLLSGSYLLLGYQ